MQVGDQVAWYLFYGNENNCFGVVESIDPLIVKYWGLSEGVWNAREHGAGHPKEAWRRVGSNNSLAQHQELFI
jgi:hypothetical protein